MATKKLTTFLSSFTLPISIQVVVSLLGVVFGSIFIALVFSFALLFISDIQYDNDMILDYKSGNKIAVDEEFSSNISELTIDENKAESRIGQSDLTVDRYLYSGDSNSITYSYSVQIDLPPTVLINSVSIGKQTRPLNCEFQSASDLAWYYGFPYTWNEIFMRVGHDPGGNPHVGFVGRSFDDLPGQMYPNGYGVYAEPIALALQDIGLNAEVHYRESSQWLKKMLAESNPVMVWAIANMAPAKAETWTAADGTVIRAARGEHTFLVVGYDAGGVWVGDPWDGLRHHYPWQDFLTSWDIFERMSIVIIQD